MGLQDEILEAFGGQSFVQEIDGDLQMVNRVIVDSSSTDTLFFNADKAMSVVAGWTTDENAGFDDAHTKAGLIVCVDENGKKVMISMGPEAYINVLGDMMMHLFRDEVLVDMKEVLKKHNGRLYREY